MASQQMIRSLQQLEESMSVSLQHLYGRSCLTLLQLLVCRPTHAKGGEVKILQPILDETVRINGRIIKMKFDY